MTTVEAFSRRPDKTLQALVGRSRGRCFVSADVGGRVYVTVANTDSYGSKLYSLDEATGATVWGPVELGGPYYWAGRP